MLPLYGLRKKLGLADRGGRKNWFRRRLSPLERTIAELDVGQAGGEPSGDPELTRRIVEMYRERVADFTGYGNSMWSGINRLAAPLHGLLINGSPPAITRALDQPHTTNLLLGFDNPVAAPWGFVADDRNLLSNEVGPGAAGRIYLALRRLAEALGAVNLANPETGTGTVLSPDEYLGLIEQRLGTNLAFPNFYPREEGLRTAWGIVSFRPLQAIYQAWRLRQLGAQRVVEIGAGLGRTAFYARLLGIPSYTIVDIPLSNVAQAHFLGRALGSDAISLDPDAEGALRILGPSFVTNTTEWFDVVLNVDSLSEMDQAAAAGYVAFARRAAKALLSINREWDGAPRLTELLGDATMARYPYWMRDGYVEELASFT